MSLNMNQIEQEVAAIVQQVTLTTADKAKASTEGKTALDSIRTLAAEVAAEMPDKVAEVAKYLHASLIFAKVPQGTADPYKQAFTGYVVAVSEGVDITKGAGTDGSEPMTASTAREFNKAKKEREERAAIKEVRDNISKALKRAKTIEMLRDILELVEDIVPAAATANGAVETITDPKAILAQLFSKAA